MKYIKVLGSGRLHCETTARLIQLAATGQSIDIELENITDLAEILAYGVMSTPAVVIDDKVVHAGGVPTREMIDSWL